MAYANPSRPSLSRGVHPRERVLYLVLGDLIGAFFALFLTLYIWANWTDEWLNFSWTFLLTRPPWWFYLLPFIWIFLIVDTYNVYRIGNSRATLSSVFLSAVIGFVVYTIVYFFPSEPGSLPRLGVPIFLIFASVGTVLWHHGYSRLFTMRALLRRVLVIGAGRAGEALFRMMGELSQPPFEVVGIIDDDPEKLGTEFHGCRVLGGANQLLVFAEQLDVTDVVVAISGPINAPLFQALLRAQEKGLEIVRMQTLYEEMLGRVPIFHQESDWLVRSFVEQARPTTLYLVAKRALDIFGALVGLAIIALLYPFVLIANLLESGLPVFYTQTRAGLFDQPYEIVKFRTMVQDAEKEKKLHWTVEGDHRVTRVGWFLRKTHLDELPQLVNVLKGEMSLVGPRPERPELIAYYQERVPFYRARLLVKPGLTGWAQVHQEYASTIEETNVKLEYDLYYIKHRSFFLDMIILLRTPATVFGFRGR